MASGGGHKSKMSASEPRPRGGWQRTTSMSDKEDNISLSSMPNELRPNNWIVSNDGERNNERNLLKRRENVPRFQRYDGMESHLRPVANHRDDRNNRNNNKQNHNEMNTEEKPGSSLMVSRLMQIRGYIKQASSMMDSLRKSGDPPGYRNEMDRLQKLMEHLKEQERNYTSLLQNSLSVREENGMNDLVRELSPNPDFLEDTTSIDLDVQSEVSDREERSASATSASLRPRIEDRLGLTPDIDGNGEEEEEEEEAEDDLAQSESSDNSGTMDDTVITNRKNRDFEFGFMEDELAAGGFQNPKEAAETLLALRQQQELLTKLVEQQEQMRALRDRQSSLLALQQDAEAKLVTAKQKSNEAQGMSRSLEEAASNMSTRAEALANLESNAGRQTDPTLSDIRQQLQYLRNELKSQVGGNELNTQASEAAGVNLSGSQADRKKEKPAGRVPPPRPPSPRVAERLAAAMNFPPVPAVSDPPEEMSKEQLQTHLRELLCKRDKLDQLLADEFSTPLMALPAEEMDQSQLQNKLRDLQRKKSRMDDMMHEIQSLRANPVLLLNNGAAPTSQTSRGQAQAQALADDPVAASTQGSEEMANGVVDMLEARQKLQKLNEVKERLNSLKSLVHYYRSVEDGQGRSGEAEDQSSLPAYSDYEGEQEPTRDRGLQNIPVQETRQGRETLSKTAQNIPVHVQTGQDESDENNSSSNSDSESQLSSLGPWGDDPEIQEKVKKLKSAKEKLKRLQNLVAMVQHAPETAGQLPDNLADIAANIEDVESQLESGEQDRNNASASEGEVQDRTDRDLYYQSKMQEQLSELDQLKDEKERLLAIQNQLQSLHDRFQQGEQGNAGLEAEEEEEEDDVDERVQQAATRPKSQNKPQQNNQQQQQQQQSSGPSVTFSSNEEVYDKMRKQRMLREELRDKKKQLESIMKKDRNKKQYYKNQDNQSDTVSYSTEAFGAPASVDATMATWGGSTVDNLESITEDGAADPQDNEEDEEDDAYPIDGILQVEEEEEENQSDNETYTIEEDVRQRRKARAMQGASNSEMNVRKPKRTFPRARTAGTRPKEAWARQGQSDFNKWSRSNRKSRQENFRSAEDILQEDEAGGPQDRTIEELQKQLEQTSLLCQSLLENQPGPQLSRQSAAGFGSHSQLMPDLQQQLQQQQLMMSLNQCYQQISMQQMEMQNMQRQMQSMFFQMSDNSELNDSSMMSEMRTRPLQPSLFSPMLARQSPNLLMPGDPFQFNPVYQHMSPNTRLLRRAEPESTFTRMDQSETGERQRNVSARGARSSRTDSYVQKKKSVSPPQLSNASGKFKSTVNKSYAEEEEEEEKEAENTGYDSDRPMTAAQFEQYLSRKRREFFERNHLPDNTKQQPSSDNSGARRSSKLQTTDDNQQYRPGLSAGISGAGYQEDGRSVTSSVLSSVAAMAQALSSQPENRDTRDSDDPNEMSLFETLRETIYSEVATLISQNENRPHYLIELFRELQLLTTDYLRQRVLYDIKDVVSKFLVEDNSVSAPPPPWMNASAGNYTQSELTPSESIVTSDEEDVKYLMQTKLKQKVAANLVARAKEQKTKGSRSGGLVRSGSLKNDQYDYQECAEQDSSVSTPSNSYWDSPFNQDTLGETVIHLDKTMEKMREYEKKLAAKDAKVKSAVDRLRRVESADVCSSSAMDQGSESSVTSETVPYPRIDTQQLDQQIKSIMTEVIPVIKEHMDNMCSPQLLAYIKRLVLSLTRQYGGGQEFARFFHRQLGSILQDTLAKYEGRKMRECGEDLLVDMSEVLFNELAFFRLMQDLDDPLIAEKLQKAQDEEQEKEPYEESDTTESTANASDNPDEDDQNDDETKATQTEEEDLGKARDDALASEMEIQDADDKDDDPESPFKGVQIELAPSETKPYTRIGSDEDDESATDESQSNEDPSETAVSINARRRNYNEDFEEDGTSDAVAEGIDGMGESTYHMVTEDQTQDADQGAGSVPQQPTEHMNGDILNGDIEVITMDDLPASLTVMSEEELQQKVSQEQQQQSGPAVILDTLEGQQELAGDPQHLRDPGETNC